MRRCKIVTWTLILSIINFALGAPAAVREGRLEMSVDVDVADGGTAMSQKRNDPLDDGSTSNAAATSWKSSDVNLDRSPSLPSLTLSDLERLRGEPDRSPTPQNMNPSEFERLREELDRSPTPQNMNPSEFERLREELDRSPTPQSMNPSLLDQLWGDPGGRPIGLFIPPESPESVTSSWRNYAPSNPGSPAGSHPGSMGGPPLPPLAHSGQSVDPGTLPSTSHQSRPLQSPTGGSPMSQPGSPDGHSPSPQCGLANCDALSSTGGQPTPPQSPARDPVTPPPPSPEPLPDSFLDKLLKDKFKRHSSGSSTVNSAQMVPRSINIPT